MINLTRELIQKFNVPGPRYTSYPTAPEWKSGFASSQYQQTLVQFGQSDRPLSLYVHIPFCQTQCYFCGCNVVIRKQKESVGDDYLTQVEKEWQLVSSAIARKPLIKQLHWGGGTPNYLSAKQMKRLFESISNQVQWDLEAEIAIEIDPRTVQEGHLTTLKQLGFNRISMGIQDIDPKVQKAINRIQPLEQIQTLFKSLRDLQFPSINVDLIYGLPYQSLEGFQHTIEAIIALKPDRIALYSFARIPWLKSHQNLIPNDALPDANTKLDLFLQAREQFVQAGYLAIGMDHFALPTDAMAKAFLNNRLYRNFMGYALQYTRDYVGLGVTSIGYVNDHFIQNAHDLKSYVQHIHSGELACEKGLELSQDDLLRQWVIVELMCHSKLNKEAFEIQFKQRFDDYFADVTDHLKTCEADGLLIQTPTNIELTELGKLFVRNVCMGFDWYYQQQSGHKQFSKTV